MSTELQRICNKENRRQLSPRRLEAAITLGFFVTEFLGETLPRGCRLLDIGCGLYPYTYLDYQKNKVVFLDASDYALSKLPDGCVSICADARKLPFEDESFDCVLSKQVYNSVGDSLVEEMLRVLRPGGTLCLIDIEKKRPLLRKGYPFQTTILAPKLSTQFEEIEVHQISSFSDKQVGTLKAIVGKGKR